MSTQQTHNISVPNATTETRWQFAGILIDIMQARYDGYKGITFNVVIHGKKDADVWAELGAITGAAFKAECVQSVKYERKEEDDNLRLTIKYKPPPDDK